MNVDTPQYVRENFNPSDRLAVVLLNKRLNSAIQRLASAEMIAAPDFQNWLAEHNERNYDVYISMNALRPEATGRTKPDIAAIRHIYLDFDENGTSAVNEMLAQSDLPKPNYILNTSPHKYQTIWQVEGFAMAQAEDLQRSLVREFNADPAAVDASRVLRIPGFFNHKYDRPHLVQVETLSRTVHTPEQFPALPILDRNAFHSSKSRDRAATNGTALSQSEKDWGYALRALARGDAPKQVATAIAEFRRHDKPNPHYYADLTVRKAAEYLATNRADEKQPLPDR